MMQETLINTWKNATNTTPTLTNYEKKQKKRKTVTFTEGNNVYHEPPKIEDRPISLIDFLNSKENVE